MRNIVTIKLAQIDHGKLPHNKKVLAFALDMLAGNIFPPINVERVEGGRFKLRGGRHRLSAHKLIGEVEIRAWLPKETSHGRTGRAGSHPVHSASH